MTVASKQARLVEDLGIIENAQERLAAVVDRARRLPPLGESERVEANRVTACVSAVWIVAARGDGGRLRLRSDADSPLVRGLVALLCEVYDGATPEDAAATEPDVLEQLGLLRDLTPTRRNGLAGARARIRELAAGLAG
ncbi:SufE protein probably involved in Fe-S center assembly [Opitutaceae bacterium TAV1]|nr:Fe-S metabolism protein SufE [Opitutaceae bacterium TAV5]EIP99107.1 SufE protein probably involved in Fe-S center assembly [Opitutaceae bacterium TAV1]